MVRVVVVVFLPLGPGCNESAVTRAVFLLFPGCDWNGLMSDRKAGEDGGDVE